MTLLLNGGDANCDLPLSLYAVPSSSNNEFGPNFSGASLLESAPVFEDVPSNQEVSFYVSSGDHLFWLVAPGSEDYFSFDSDFPNNRHCPWVIAHLPVSCVSDNRITIRNLIENGSGYQWNITIEHL